MQEGGEAEFWNLKLQIEVLEGKNIKLEEENHKLASIAKKAGLNKGEMMDAVVALESQKCELEKKLEIAETERGELRQKVADLNRMTKMGEGDKDYEIMNLKKMLDSNSKLVAKSTVEIKELTARLINLLKEKKEWQKKEKLLNDEYQALKDSLTEKENEISEAEKELEELKEILRREKGYDPNAVKRMKELTTQVKELQKVVKARSRENTKQVEIDPQSERIIRELREEKDTMMRTINDMEIGNKKSQNAAMDYRSTCKKLSTDKRKLEEELKKLKKDIINMSQDRIEYEDKEIDIGMFDEKLELLRVKDKQHRLAAENTELLHAVRARDRQIEDLDTRIQDLQHMLKEKQRHNDEFLNVIWRLKDKNKSKIEGYEKKRQGDLRASNSPVLSLSRRDEAEEREINQNPTKLVKENRRLRAIIKVRDMSLANGVDLLPGPQKDLLKDEEQPTPQLNRKDSFYNWIEKFQKSNHKLYASPKGEKSDEDKLFPDITLTASLVSPRNSFIRDKLKYSGLVDDRIPKGVGSSPDPRGYPTKKERRDSLLYPNWQSERK